jgi:hypothetical protein
MVGNRGDVRVRVLIEMLASLPVVASALNVVEQMRNYAGGRNQLTPVVEIDAPRIAGAPRKHLELMPRWMITPDRRVEGHTLAVRCARLAHARVSEHAVATVEPAVRSPGECVERFVCVLPAPAVEQDFRLAVGHIVPVAIGNEHQVRSRPDPHAAEADFEPANEVQPFGEHFPLVETAVAIGVFKDNNAIATFVARCANRVFVGLSDPNAATIVERHGDRLLDIRLGSEHFRRETRGQFHRRGGLVRRHIGERNLIACGGLRGRRGRGEQHCQDAGCVSVLNHR